MTPRQVILRDVVILLVLGAGLAAIYGVLRFFSILAGIPFP